MDYKNGKIYTIRSYQTDDIYIGSTTQTLTKRLSKHKYKFKYWKEGKYTYTTSYELIKYDDVYIELIELFPCSSKMELDRREGEFIRSMDCVNKRIEGRTKKEYLEDNKEKTKEYHQQYYLSNKDKILEYHQQYHSQNAIKLIEKKKEYHKLNDDKLKQKFNCKCGGKYTHQGKSHHLKTQKHTNYIISTNNTE
jgi:hypothetical protein